jgi:asparagine synthase (glutamine-hydrolysing)
MREASLLAANTYAGECSTADVLRPAIKLALIPRQVHRALSGRKRRSQKYTVGAEGWLRQSFASEIDVHSLLQQAQDNKGYGLPVNQSQYHARIFRRAYVSRMHYGIDMLATQFPLEIRHPYLDKRLVNFCVSLPLEQKIRDGWLKSILRRSNIERIPSEVRWSKGREHVGWKFLQATYVLLNDEICAAVNDRQHSIYDYFSHSKVLRAYHACQQSGSYEGIADLMRFYGLYCWLTSRPC